MLDKSLDKSQEIVIWKIRQVVLNLKLDLARKLKAAKMLFTPYVFYHGR